MPAGPAATRWFGGLGIGVLLPLVVLSSLMPLGIVIAVAVLAWIVRGNDGVAAGAGVLIGSRLVTLAEFLAANASCSSAPSCYQNSPVIPFAAVLALLGLALTLLVVRRT